MKLIIDIDDNVFTRLFDNGIDTSSDDREVIDRAVRNGKPYEERPHGEWIIDGHHYKCSRCGKTLAIMFSETDDGDLIGCPFCLADMRGGRE